jgi:hypothetical protein
VELVGVNLVVLVVLLTLVALVVVVPVLLVLMDQIVRITVEQVVMEHDIPLNMVQITQYITREAAVVVPALEVVLMVLVV